MIHQKPNIINILNLCYIFIDLKHIARKMLANFRCSGHNLTVEKGRHTRVEMECRFCSFCLERNVFSIEDEFRF